MAESASHKIDIEHCRTYRSLVSVKRDLSIAVEMLEHVMPGRTSNDDSDEITEADEIEEAFWIAALVRFGRCFGKGSRPWAAADAVLQLRPELQAEYAYFKLIRDKMVAHATWLGEETVPYVYVLVMRDKPIVLQGVHARESRTLSLGTIEATKFMALLKALIEVLERMMEVEGREVLARLQAIPLHQILNWPTSRAADISFDRDHPRVKKQISLPTNPRGKRSG